MEVIGAFGVIGLYICVITFVLTGRWIFLGVALWTAPCIGLGFFSPKGIEVNGLVILICILAFIIEYLSLIKLKMWNVNSRRVKIYVYIIYYIISFIGVYYCLYESQRLGYLPNFQGVRTEVFLRKWIVLILIMGLNIMFMNLLILTIDLFFSVKYDFVLIKCEPFISEDFGFISEKIIKRRYLFGINNGKEYYFGINQRGYILLKEVKSLKLEVFRGIMGGVYIKDYPKEIEADERRNKKINNWLIKKAIFATICFLIVIAIIYFTKNGV